MENQEENTQNSTIDICFASDLAGLFWERFAKAQKKYAKVGQELQVVSQKTEIKRVIGSLGLLEDIRYTKVSIARPMINVRPGVEFWGVVSLAGGTKTVYRTEACPEDLVLSELELTCDHCKTNRRRKKYFIFQEDGKLMRLGSTCVQPYYGLDLERILRVSARKWRNLGNP